MQGTLSAACAVLIAGAEALHGQGGELVLCRSGASRQRGQYMEPALDSRCCGGGGLGLGQGMGVLGSAGGLGLFLAVAALVLL